MTKLIAGLDEVGMGCLAGPVVIAVAAFPEEAVKPAGVRDSKKCSKTDLVDLYKVVLERATFIGFGFGTVEQINLHGIAGAWQMAAAMALTEAPEFVELVVDGTRAVEPYEGEQRVQPKADLTDWQVSAASIVAKVLRDSHMTTLASSYPHFGWETNVGYGSQHHRDAIIKHGPTTFHRAKYIRKVQKEKAKKLKVSRFAPPF